MKMQKQNGIRVVYVKFLNWSLPRVFIGISTGILFGKAVVSASIYPWT
jgi:hypothetical protein